MKARRLSVIRTQIQLTEDQANALKLMAAKEGVSMAELIRISIDRFLRDTGREAAPDQVILAREAAGKYGCALGDLAENHDRYFAGDDR